MNKQKILILTIGILTVSILGGFYLINKPNSNELNNEVEKSTLKQTVEDNFTSITVISCPRLILKSTGPLPSSASQLRLKLFARI